MTGFILKIIALITMVLDHIKYAVPVTNCFLTQYFGRLSFPIFAFVTTDGWGHTRNKKRYILKMFIFAFISQIPFMMFRSLVADKFLLNIMFTFLFAILGLWSLDFFENRKELSNFLKFLIMFCICATILACGFIIPVDYNWFGIAVVWLFYILRNNKVARTITYPILVILYYLSAYMTNINAINILSVIFTALPGFIILFYNGKEGRKMKYFFYTFYPVHMLIVYGLSFLF